MKTLLLVDNSALIRKLAIRMLQPGAYEIREAENGSLALDSCKEDMPEGILLDWNMPVMDGLSFLKALRALPQGRQPKVLFCTTENEAAKIQIALEAGADEFIMKPFDEAILSSKLAMVGLA